ncbi:MAG: amidase domain-containing protein [Erysipelotrichaceae bacterium]|nr:amidase domain-containing protein [Erysipelotrichaceae bacterium]
MKKFKVLLLTFSIFCFITPFSNVYAESNENQINKGEYYADRLNKNGSFDKVTTNEAKLRNSQTDLLITFENQERALSNFIDKYKSQLSLIKEKFDLDDLISSNYQTYYQTVKEITENGILSYEDIGEMLAFFDIFENFDVNKELQVSISEYNKTGSQSTLNYLEENLPNYYDSMSIDDLKVSLRSMPLPNLQAGINYATKYAVKPNPNYYTWSSDCTNFVSQILKAAGVNEVYTGNENSGWWYRSGSKRSISWINADTFTRYMGRGSTNKWSLLMATAKPGSFIASDFGGDGVADHCAFITSKAGGTVKIAQHTTNYHKWSNETNWPVDNNKRILYHVR